MKRHLALFLLCLLSPQSSILSPALAQQGSASSVKAVVRLNRAPVNKEVLETRLPRPIESRLDNGLTVIILERHKVPTAQFHLMIKSGALMDPKDRPGLARFTAEMLREGTERRASAQLSAEIDELGASLSGSAGFGSNLSEISAGGLVEDADRILELMSDVVLRPAFPAAELEKYKQRALVGLEQQRASPGFLAQERFRRALYKDFPASVISATPESVQRATREELAAFHERHYAPNNAILGVVGDLKADEALALVRKHFGGWKSRLVPEAALGPVPAPEATRIHLVDRPGSVQTNIVVGGFALRRDDPDYVPLRVMHRVLGGGPSARLFLNLREEKGYTYGAYSRFTADIYLGEWQATAEVRNAVTDGALGELIREIKRIGAEKVPEAELGEAQRSIVARFALSLEQPGQLLQYWLDAAYYDLPRDYWDRYPREVMKTSQAKVLEMAKKYGEQRSLTIVCVGDAKEIKGVLEKYGSVSLYDVNGKSLQ